MIMRPSQYVAGTLVLSLASVSLLSSCYQSAGEGAVPQPGVTGQVGGHPVALSEATFDGEVQSGLVLVDFWAAWCGPCRELAPLLDELAGDYAGRAVIAKVDIDAQPALAERYGIASIPNLKIFKNGRVVDEIVGLVPKSEIARTLDRHL